MVSSSQWREMGRENGEHRETQKKLKKKKRRTREKLGQKTAQKAHTGVLVTREGMERYFLKLRTRTAIFSRERACEPPHYPGPLCTLYITRESHLHHGNDKSRTPSINKGEIVYPTTRNRDCGRAAQFEMSLEGLSCYVGDLW